MSILATAPAANATTPPAVLAVEAFINGAAPLIPVYGPLIAAFAPAGEEVINYILGLFVKHAAGVPVTSDDWKGLITLHASKTAEQRLDQDLGTTPAPAPVV